MKAPEPDRGYSTSLNALRFFAAGLVLLAHFGFLSLRALGVGAPVLNVIEARSLATSIFFVLSGFVLALSLQRRPEPYIQFVLAKFARLYPLHLLAMAITLPMVLMSSEPWSAFTHTLVWLAAAHGVVPQWGMTFYVPGWAVTAFALGYLVAPKVWAMRWLRTSFLWLVLLALWLLVLMPNVWTVADLGERFVYSLGGPRAGLAEAQAINTAHAFVPSRLCEIVFGCLLAMLALRHQRSRWLRILSGDTALVLATGAMVYLVEAAISRRPAFYLLTHGLLLPVLGWLVVALWRNEGRAKRLLRAGWLQRGGRISSLLYFFQWPWFWGVYAVIMSVRGDSMDAVRTNPALFAVATLGLVAVCLSVEASYNRFSKRLGEQLYGWWLRKGEAAQRALVSAVVSSKV